MRRSSGTSSVLRSICIREVPVPFPSCTLGRLFSPIDHFQAPGAVKNGERSDLPVHLDLPGLTRLGRGTLSIRILGVEIGCVSAAILARRGFKAP